MVPAAGMGAAGMQPGDGSSLTWGLPGSPALFLVLLPPFTVLTRGWDSGSLDAGLSWGIFYSPLSLLSSLSL